MAMRSTLQAAPTGPRAAIRLRPVPRFEPPYDDEATSQPWATTSRQLALNWPADDGRERPEPPPAVSPVVTGASGDAKLAVRRFVRLCVEVLNGFRPAAHLRRMALPAEAADVVAQGLAGARRAASLRGSAGRRPQRRPAPVGVMGVKICEPRHGAVEVAVTLVTGDRTWALAFRLELHQQSWAVTALLII